jgi:hypothetical protein
MSKISNLLGGMVSPLFKMLPALPFYGKMEAETADYMDNLENRYVTYSLNMRINLKALIVEYSRYPPHHCIIRRQAMRNGFWGEFVAIVAWLYKEQVISLQKSVNLVLSKLSEPEPDAPKIVA